MKKICLLIISCFLISGCGYDVYEMPKEAYINFNDLNIPVYEKLTVNDIIKDTNVQILNGVSKVKTSSLGDETKTIFYKYKRRKYKIDVNYTVIDNTPPTFIQASTVRSTLINEVIYPCENIVYGDDYDVHPTCSIDGEIDFTRAGTYNVEYVLQDYSGNQQRKNLRVNVLYRYPDSSSTPYEYPKINFSDALAKYKNDSTMVGLDISRWQGEIDFEAVKNAGVEFVILRMGVENYPEDTLDPDSRFHEYYEKAKNANLKIGVYIYTSALNRKTGMETAEWALEMLNGDKLDLPIAYDWENWTDFMDYNINIHSLNEGYQGFKEVLNKHGYKTMLYGSYSYLENVWNTEDETIWLAHYNDTTDYPGKYLLWQFTDRGVVDGITENTVDINVYYKENE